MSRASRYIQAPAKRKTTEEAPFLSLKSIEYSLTEGTNIPPPALEEEAANKKSKLSSASGGPLSSHPVTPDGTLHTSAFPSLNTDNDEGYSRPYEASPTGHAPKQVDQAPPYKNERTRRPSFAQRLLRSIGSNKNLHGKSPSSTYLPETPNGGRPTTPGGMSTASRPRSSFDKLRDTLRGSKRPITPSADAAMQRPDTQSGMPPAQRPRMSQTNSGSLPQLVRKRSMDFIGSARRMSGVWSRGDAMDSERKTERVREQMDREARIMRQQAPKLPTLREGLGTESLDGDAMFGNIGREETWIVSGKA